MRTILTCCLIGSGAAVAHSATAQETPSKRLASVVAVAVEEYRHGVDAAGNVISKTELDEARSFFVDAHDVAQRVTGDQAPKIRLLLDSLAAAVSAAKPLPDIEQLARRLNLALGPEGAIDLPTRAVDALAGHALYTQNCASCHGERGIGNGPVSPGMNPPPAALAGDSAGTIEPRLMYHVISVGVRGTAMASWADRLTSDQRWDVIAYVNTLRDAAGPAAAAVAATDAVKTADTDIRRKLDSAMVAGQQGRTADATDFAFDAYSAFEPFETIVHARKPALKTRLESEFLTFRTALRASDLPGAQSALAKIRADLPDAVLIAEGGTSPWTEFMESLLIIMREGFEAILVIAAIVAMLRRSGNAARVKDIWLGAGLGLVASAVTAVALNTILEAIPASREVIEGITVLIAVGVLFSVSYWVLSKVEAKHWQAFVHERVHAAIAGGGRAALIGVAFLVVYREGAETALFFQALLQGGASSGHVLGGLAVGAVLLTGVYALLNVFGVRLPLRAFFAATGTLLYAMAFVFMGKGLRDLQEGGVLPNTLLHGLPTIDAIGIYPSAQTLLGQFVLLALFVFACWRTFIVPRRALS